MRRRVVRATLDLLAVARGGRYGAIESGYRSLVRFEGSNDDFGFELVLETPLMPGACGTAALSFWAVDDLPVLTAGQRFELREGTRVVGYGEILDLDPDA